MVVTYRRIEITEHVPDGGMPVTIVRFVDRNIIDATQVIEMGDELFGLVEKHERRHILLNFTGVNFLSSGALCKLILLEKKIKACNGVLRFCNVIPGIYEVFVITRLNQLFDVKGTEGEALNTWLASAAV